MKKLSIFFVLSLFFVSCMAGKSLQDDWLKNPPSDTPSFFYGVGFGETKEDATKNALSNISSRISVSVESTFKSSLASTRYGKYEDVESEVKNEVVAKSKNIEYTNVKLLKSKYDGEKWAVLVEVDRDDLAQNYIRKLNKIDQKLQNEWSIYQKATPFEKLKISAKIDALLKKTDSYFALLHVLKKDFDEGRYSSRYKRYTKDIRELKNNLVFKIVSDEASEPLASLIEEKLSDMGAKISGGSNYNVLLKITTKAKKRKYRSTNPKFAKLTFALRKTTIRAYDENGNIISNVVYKTKEGSELGFEDALSKTTKYKKKIAQMGIVNFLTGAK